jgi:hypothetical protein
MSLMVETTPCARQRVSGVPPSQVTLPLGARVHDQAGERLAVPCSRRSLFGGSASRPRTGGEAGRPTARPEQPDDGAGGGIAGDDIEVPVREDPSFAESPPAKWASLLRSVLHCPARADVVVHGDLVERFAGRVALDRERIRDPDTVPSLRR